MEAFDYDLRAKERRDTEIENRVEYLFTKLGKMHDDLNQPECFDIYKNGKFCFESCDISDAIHEASVRDDDDDWEVRPCE